MAHIYTYDEIKQEFEDRNYILITDHKLRCSEKYEYICKKHVDKGSQFIDWGHFHSSKKGCCYCGRERTIAARKKDLSEFNAKELAESKGFEYVDVIRRNSKIYVLFICPKHREYGVQEMWYFNMKRDIKGCQHCIGRNDSEEYVLMEMYEANPNMVLLDSFRGRTGRVRALCTIHDAVTYTTPSNIIEGKGCYYCGMDRIRGQNTAEYKIGRILKNNNISYIHQYSFEDCRDKKPLPFDFYLTNDNVLIEYDGEGHYFPVNFGGIDDDSALQQMLYTQSHDKIKTEYCKNNNIQLIRIPYWEKNSLEKYLIDKLKQYGVITNLYND